MEFMFVAIYGLHTIKDRLILWEDLRRLVTIAQGPLLCMGDYNAVKYFNDFLINTGMQELKIVEDTYTWTNRHTCSRIDGALVNVEWIIQMPIMEVNILRPWNMKEVWKKLRRVNRAIKELNNTEFGRVRDRIQTIRTQLHQIQHDMIDHR
ncbi:hypothetical protein R3W88_015208 [Solanum pinnatisectum]|uniref:Endonuclease/exonuclease/phosphatase domain-containing protein n=1 Tax=Solanum pinnatisectum TaxID=50273 RepID=A0AAV9KWX1_9SOLN|nr:hypothetical protein R3W88_015208 [Solanum pinnatisectum]